MKKVDFSLGRGQIGYMLMQFVARGLTCAAHVYRIGSVGVMSFELGNRSDQLNLLFV